MSYKSLQAALKSFRNNGVTLQCKLNAKLDVLQAEYDKLTTFVQQEQFTVQQAETPSETIEQTISRPEDEEPSTRSAIAPMKLVAYALLLPIVAIFALLELSVVILSKLLPLIITWLLSSFKSPYKLLLSVFKTRKNLPISLRRSVV